MCIFSLSLTLSPKAHCPTSVVGAAMSAPSTEGRRVFVGGVRSEVVAERDLRAVFDAYVCCGAVAVCVCVCVVCLFD